MTFPLNHSTVNIALDLTLDRHAANQGAPFLFRKSVNGTGFSQTACNASEYFSSPLSAEESLCSLRYPGFWSTDRPFSLTIYLMFESLNDMPLGKLSDLGNSTQFHCVVKWEFWHHKSSSFYWLQSFWTTILWSDIYLPKPYIEVLILPLCKWQPSHRTITIFCSRSITTLHPFVAPTKILNSLNSLLFPTSYCSSFPKSWSWGISRSAQSVPGPHSISICCRIKEQSLSLFWPIMLPLMNKDHRSSFVKTFYYHFLSSYNHLKLFNLLYT